MHNSSMSLAKRIRTARKAAKLTVADVARQFGVKPQAVNQWEPSAPGSKNKPTRPDLARLPKLAELFNVNLEWLLSGEGPRTRAPHLVTEERTALAIFRALPGGDRMRWLRMMNAYLDPISEDRLIVVTGSSGAPLYEGKERRGARMELQAGD